MGWTYLPCNSTGQRTGAAQRENSTRKSAKEDLIREGKICPDLDQPA